MDSDFYKHGKLERERVKRGAPYTLLVVSKAPINNKPRIGIHLTPCHILIYKQKFQYGLWGIQQLRVFLWNDKVFNDTLYW